MKTLKSILGENVYLVKMSNKDGKTMVRQYRSSSLLSAESKARVDAKIRGYTVDSVRELSKEKDDLDEARYVTSADFKVSASGRKVHKRKKIADDDYDKENEVDDEDENEDEKKESFNFEGLEQLEEDVWYCGEDLELDEAQQRYSSSYQFTHKPGDAESEKKLSGLKKMVKGTGKRVVLMGRLGKDNPNAHKYKKGGEVSSNRSQFAGTHKYIKKADAAHHDVYVYDRRESYAPVAPVPDKKYIKGTPENQALKAKSKPINGMPTNVKEEQEQFKVGDFVKDHTGKIHRVFGVNGTNLETGIHYGKDKYGGTNNLHVSKAKKVPRPKDVKEEVEHVEEGVNKSDVPAYLRKKTGDQLTTKDLEKERTQNRSHPETIKKINGTGVKEEVEQVFEAINADNYHVTSEPSQFGGHRPKVVHKEKGTTMYLGQHSYKKPEHAAAHAKAYLDAYERRGPNHASEKASDYAKANKDKQYVKESIEHLDELTDEQIAKLHADAAAHAKKSLDKQSDDRIAAAKNPPKKPGFFARVGQKQINMVKGAWHGLTKEETELVEAMDPQEARFFLLARLGLVEKSDVPKLRTAMSQLNSDKALSIAQRDLVLSTFQSLVDIVTGDDAVFTRVRMNVQKEGKESDIPFEGPYKKIKDVVKDKSGAVHTPVSRVRHLARMALKKQAEKK